MKTLFIAALVGLLVVPVAGNAQKAADSKKMIQLEKELTIVKKLQASARSRVQKANEELRLQNKKAGLIKRKISTLMRKAPQMKGKKWEGSPEGRLCFRHWTSGASKLAVFALSGCCNLAMNNPTPPRSAMETGFVIKKPKLNKSLIEAQRFCRSYGFKAARK
jgi:hypothetical protein